MYNTVVARWLPVCCTRRRSSGPARTTRLLLPPNAWPSSWSGSPSLSGEQACWSWTQLPYRQNTSKDVLCSDKCGKSVTQTLHVLVASKIQKIQYSDWPKCRCALWHYVISHILLNQMSFQMIWKTSCQYNSRQNTFPDRSWYKFKDKLACGHFCSGLSS